MTAGMTTAAPNTVADALAAAIEALGRAGCESPTLDAEVLLADAMGIDPAHVRADPAARVSRAVGARFVERVTRRAAHEPTAYILGRCRFRGLELEVDERVLVPDPKAGTLVDAALRLPGGARVHDVGTGSGCIALAIKAERPDLIVTGSDISAAAIDVARHNAARLQLDVGFSVARGHPPGDYDLVVANLPYADTHEQRVPVPPEDARYQPHIAVFAGAEGLEEIRALVADSPSGARLALAHAPAQTSAVQRLLTNARTYAGAAGRGRATIGRVP